MGHRTSRAAARGRTLVLATLVTALGLGALGCSTAKTECTITSLQNRQTYLPGFNQAYSSRDDRGDLNVVLAADVKPCATAALGGQTALKQILHVRVLWEPGRAVKADAPTATNAAIRWYVFTDAAGPGEMIEYAGTGLADVEPDGAITKVTIRNATLNATTTRGLNDPIGPARFQGTIVAKTNKARVGELLSEVKTTIASASLTRHVVEGRTAAGTVEP